MEHQKKLLNLIKEDNNINTISKKMCISEFSVKTECIELFKKLDNFENILLSSIKNEYDSILKLVDLKLDDKIELDNSLSEEQKICVNHACENKSIFITSSAGCGKTYCLKEIIRVMKLKYSKEAIGVTSLSGCSSKLINGTTVHSYLKIGLARKSADGLFNDLKTKYLAKYTILKIKLKILIIDEISMMDKVLFEKISEYLQLIKESDLPFGGIQVILCGDFCQLAPVSKSGYCFESNIWKDLNLLCINLTIQFRQNEDPEFKKILTKLRFGQIDDEIYEKLLKCKSSSMEINGIKPTRLFSINKYVDLINQNELKKMIEKNGGKSIKFTIIVKSDRNILIKNIIKSGQILENIELTLGAQVMVTYNIDIYNGLVNGTLGIIINMDQKNKVFIKTITNEIFEINYIDYVHIDDDSSSILFSYMPLKLAFSYSIHKAQGQTIDYLSIDFKNVFTFGQSYTALSRAKSMDRLVLTNLTKKSFKCHPKVLKFYKNIDNLVI